GISKNHPAPRARSPLWLLLVVAFPYIDRAYLRCQTQHPRGSNTGCFRSCSAAPRGPTGPTLTALSVCFVGLHSTFSYPVCLIVCPPPRHSARLQRWRRELKSLNLIHSTPARASNNFSF